MAPSSNTTTSQTVISTDKANADQLSVSQSTPASTSAVIEQSNTSKAVSDLSQRGTTDQPTTSQLALSSNQQIEPSQESTTSTLILSPSPPLNFNNILARTQVKTVLDFNRKLLTLRNQSCSIPNYSAMLFDFLFDEEERLDTRYNITGRLVKGVAGPLPIPFDPERIAFIRDCALNEFQGNAEAKNKMWTMCKDAMSKRLSIFRKKLIFYFYYHLCYFFGHDFVNIVVFKLFFSHTVNI